LIDTLGPDERAVIGRWIVVDGRVGGDLQCERIERLTDGILTFVAPSSDGWECLFRDPSDGRLWERTYPQSEMHGGGPPTLRLISPEEARRRYPLDHR